eukprot:TRINITY_DN5920_c0_g2_i3.p1 TRINITY_DN5920_c0_g2~~TRINITY_DN5920_c0_g2_i3.p1  ORF type:complete len:169 (+),score=23.42 TRINITY_DN5920_c0_g2_i3:417-923(+)
MFMLVAFEDDIRIQPEKLQLPIDVAVTSYLRNVFVDKVIDEQGLCVTLYDIQSVNGGYVFPGDGAPRFTVRFRLVMFRPFVGEILVGRLARCDASGLHVTCGDFFADIHIPEHLLQAPSEFDPEEKLWVWKFSGNDMFLDLNEEVGKIRFSREAIWISCSIPYSCIAG